MKRHSHPFFWILIVACASLRAEVAYNMSYSANNTENYFAVALPPAPGLATASDAVSFLESKQQSGQAGRAVRLLEQWDAGSQAMRVYAFDPSFQLWLGNNFTLNASEPVWVRLEPQARISFSVAVPPSPLKIKAGKERRRVWLVLPEGSSLKSASGLMTAFGGPGAVRRVGKRIPKQALNATFKAKDTPGTSRDFSLKPGEAFFVEFNSDQETDITLP
jgi:hypothetical protein